MSILDLRYKAGNCMTCKLIFVSTLKGELALVATSLAAYVLGSLWLNLFEVRHTTTRDWLNLSECQRLLAMLSECNFESFGLSLMRFDKTTRLVEPWIMLFLYVQRTDKTPTHALRCCW